MNKLNELLDEFADSSEEYARSGTASWSEIRDRVRESVVDYIKSVESERDELRDENARFCKLIEESNKYFLSIDDKARSSGLTYDAVRDIVHNYLIDEEEKQISFGKVVEELRSLCRVCAEDMTKELRSELMVTRSKLDRVLSICARDGIEALTLAFVQSCTDERDKAIAELAAMREQRDAYAKRVCELDQRSK